MRNVEALWIIRKNEREFVELCRITDDGKPAELVFRVMTELPGGGRQATYFPLDEQDHADLLVELLP